MRDFINFTLSIIVVALVIPLLLSLRNQRGTETQITQIGAPTTSPSSFSCSPFSEEIVHRDVSPALLRLFYLDSFIDEGCYASLLLGENGDRSLSMEKKEVEQAGPGTVSCADMLALPARNSVLLDGGPLYPVLIGKRDSNESFIEEALATDENPKSADMDNITCTLHLFSLRRANERETVSLVEIGKIGCDFIQQEPHPTIIALDLLRQVRLNCSKHSMKNNNICSDKVSPLVMSKSKLVMSKPKPKPNHIESGITFLCIFPIPFLLALYLRR